MKPIPAIDEHGEFVEARVGHRGGEPIRIVWIHGDEVAGYPVYPINPDDYAVAYWRTEDISDWPAVRERVERSRAERERVAREDAKRLEAFGVEDRTDAGVKVTYSPSGAASVDSRELFEKVIEPLLAESQKRQAIRAHAQVDEPRRPSFAEALEQVTSKSGPPNSNRASVYVTFHDLENMVRRARAASGE